MTLEKEILTWELVDKFIETTKGEAIWSLLEDFQEKVEIKNQSKIISIIDKRIEELKKHESDEIEYFDPTTSETEDIIKELESLKKEVKL
jgi:hypothetical protein